MNFLSTKLKIASTLLSIFLQSCTSSNQLKLDYSTISNTINFSKEQFTNTLNFLGEKIVYPRSTSETGQWEMVNPRDWTSGFFPGSLWYIYELTRESEFKRAAQRWTEGLIDQQYLKQTHDIGFIIFNSFGNGYKIDSIETYKSVILQAANSLTTRFNPVVGCIKSWDWGKWEYPVIIDNMMNLEILFWASKNGGTKEMYNIAYSHAKKTIEHHIRKDFSTYHVVDFDTITGSVKIRETHQGYSDESVWARGQAWAIYGFTVAYRETGDDIFLHTAENTANWFIKHLPEDYVPYWDFFAPNIPNEPKDASAAAITASALLELSGLTNNKENKTKYLNVAIEILRSLSSPKYLAKGSKSQGILLHGVGNYPKNSEIDVSLIYADYYFIEALLRYKNILKSNN